MKKLLFFALSLVIILAMSGNGLATFTEHTIESNFDCAQWAEAVDIDRDGDIDIVGAAYYETWEMKLWENDGSENFTTRYIDISFTNARAVHAADLNQDGRIDILGAAFGIDNINWWENMGLNDDTTIFLEHVIEGSFEGASSVYTADIDNDGDLDVVGAATEDGIKWFEHDGAEGFTTRTIDDTFDGAQSVYPIDLDQDGYIDVLGAAKVDDDVTWWRNDGSPADGGWTEYTIDASFNGAGCVFAKDVDADGQIDVLATAIDADDITWWENDGTPLDGGWTEHTLEGSFNHATCVYAEDMNNGGAVDILGTAYLDDDVVYWANSGWGQNTIDLTFDGARSVFAYDIDRDGQMDALACAQNADDITWFENDDIPPLWVDVDNEYTFKDDFDGANDVHAIDINHDGKIDIVASGITDDLAWFENDGSTDDWDEHSIDDSFLQARGVFAIDLDRDGNIDVLGAAYQDDDIAWFKGDGGDSWTETTIDASFNGATCVSAADFNRDGHIDVVGAAYYGDDIAWWENDGTPEGDNWAQHTIDGSYDGAIAVCVADIDNDGWMDIIGAAINDCDITWWENDGDETFTTHTIENGTYDANDLCTADVDNDGDIDILAASTSQHDVTWWENDGSPTDGGWTERTIDGTFTSAGCIYATDMDMDGDVDVLGGGLSQVAMWENDGSPADGGWTERTLDILVGDAQSITAANIDVNGTKDIIYADISYDDIVWYDMEKVWIAPKPAAPTDPDDTGLPMAYDIESLYPNPFNPTLEVVIALPHSSQLKVEVFNIIGEEVGTIADGKFDAGYHRLIFKAGNELQSGTYFIRAIVPGKFNKTSKAVLLK